MRLSMVLLVFALLSPNSQAQNKLQTAETQPAEIAPQGAFSSQLLQELATIRDAALADDYTYRLVTHLTENIGPRISGSAQAQKAVEYVGEELKKLGLEVRLEEAKVPHWVRGVETGELVEYPGQAAGTTQKVVVTALGGSTPTPTEG